LRVVAGGSVEGEIRVPSASISGSVKGNIYSAENLELTKGAVVAGDVFYNLIEMSMGSKIDGSLKHSTASAKVEPIGSVTVTSSAEKA
jgi:cytoskeletal protein CcmA (bactofilin family)